MMPKSCETELHVACRVGNPAVVEALLDKGSNPMQRNVNGQTCLHIAARQGFDLIVLRHAMQFPQLPQVKDNNGLLAIDYALLHGQLRSWWILKDFVSTRQIAQSFGRFCLIC